MKEINFNNEIYVKKSDLKGEFKPSKVQIVVLNRGWICIGSVSEKGSKTYVKNTSIIRKWGTTEGLGELAEKGELDDTVLDKCPDIEVETINIVFKMNCI
jgi:hypothetical protein